MNIPENIKYILEKIYKSESEWKALYMAIWHYHDYINRLREKPESVERNYEDLIKYLTTVARGTAYVINLGQLQQETIEKWEITLKLPATKKQHPKYEIGELLEILSSWDSKFALGHLQKMFSFLEELVRVASKILVLPTTNNSILRRITKKFFVLLGCPKEEFSSHRWKYLQEFLQCVVQISSAELLELKSAKETRNCYIHNASKISKEWLKAYKDAKKLSLSRELVGQNLESGFNTQPIFHQIEDWHDLIVSITKRIEEKITQK